MRFLIVDNDPRCVSYAEKALAHQFPNCEVSQSLTCADAIQYLANEQFDAVIIDQRHLDVPADCLIAIRKHWKCMPIVIITSGPKEQAREVFSAGADDFVTKDSVGQLLGHAVWSAIERRKGQIQIENDTAHRRKELENIRQKLRQGE